MSVTDYTESTEVMQAIKVRWDLFQGEGEPAGIATGIFDTMAPQGTEYPYVVVTDTGGTIMRMFDSEMLEAAMLQVSVFDRWGGTGGQGNTRRCAQIWDGLVRIFEGETLTMSNGSFVMFRREGRPQKTVDGDITEIFGNWRLERQFDRS